MSKIVWKYGLIAGAILSAMMFATLPFMEQIGFDYGMLIGYTGMVVAFLMIYFGVRTYRDRVAGGTVGLGRAFLVGLAITAVASTCYVATWQVIYYKFTPDFAEKYAAHAIAKAKQAGASEAQIVAQRAEMDEFARMYRNPLARVAITFLEPLPVGLLFSLLTTVILGRRKRR